MEHADISSQAIREQEAAVVDAMVRLTQLDEQHARQVVLQLCQGLNIAVDDASLSNAEPVAIPEEVEAKPEEQVASPTTEQQSVAQPDELQQQIDQGSSEISPAIEDVAEAVMASPAEDAFSSTPELSSPFAEEKSELSESPSGSMELQLGAGSDLQMSSLPETSLSLTEPVLSSVPAPGEQAPSAINITPVRTAADGETTVSVETKAIVDETPEVTAIAAPQIDAVAPSIVDTAKEVTELASAEIEVHQEEIKDNAEKVTAIAAPVISEETAAIQTQAPAIRPFQLGESPSTPQTTLRPAHVVQPGQSTPAASAEPDLIIDAELIPIDGDEDAIIIIDSEG